MAVLPAVALCGSALPRPSTPVPRASLPFSFSLSLCICPAYTAPLPPTSLQPSPLPLVLSYRILHSRANLESLAIGLIPLPLIIPTPPSATTTLTVSLRLILPTRAALTIAAIVVSRPAVPKTALAAIVIAAHQTPLRPTKTKIAASLPPSPLPSSSMSPSCYVDNPVMIPSFPSHPSSPPLY